MISEVWINGHSLGKQYLGYTTFQYDITDYIVYNEVNVIAVKAVNQISNSRFYAGSGIYRNVWLIVTSKIHVPENGMIITTPDSGFTGSEASVNVRTRISNDETKDVNVSLRTIIFDQSGVAAETETDSIILPAGEEVDVEQGIAVCKPELWSPASPNLYYAKTEIIYSGETVDTCETRFGIRYLKFDPESGVLINGEHIQLNGVCMHSDLGCLGMAVSQAAIDRQIRKLKAVGVTAIRGAHNPLSPEFVEACDRMGILLVEEAFDCWQCGKTTYGYHLYFNDYAEYDLKAMVKRDRNAPSIIMWSLGNEIWEAGQDNGLEILEMLKQWVLEEDGTRYITAGVPTWDNYNKNQWKHLQALDAAGFNYTQDLYGTAHRDDPDMIIYGSETVSAFYSRGIYHRDTYGTELYAYKAPDQQCSSYGNERFFGTAERYLLAVRDNPHVAGEFVWTGFDYLGEPAPYPWPSKSSYFGIIDTAGFEKDIFYLYKSMWTDKPTVHILPQNWNYNPGENIPVMVYTNACSVELFLNGISLGVKYFDICNDKVLHLEWFVDYVPGELRAVAKDSEGRIIAEDVVYTAGAARSIVLTSGRAFIKSDGKDLAFIEAVITDAIGNMVPDVQNRVTFNVSGGEIAGVDNGNSIDHDPYKADNRNAFSGKVLLVVKSVKGYEGNIEITAEAKTEFGLIFSNAVTISSVAEFKCNESVIADIIKTEISTVKGVRPILPQTVRIILSNGLIKENTVVIWNDISDIDYCTVGKYTVYGSVGNSDKKAKCIINVKETASVEIVHINTFQGKPPVMPTFVCVHYTDETTGALGVAWDKISKEQYEKAGNCIVRGKISGTDIEAVANISVKSVKHIDEPTSDTTVGVMPILPSNIGITFDDGETEKVPVRWNISDIDVNESGVKNIHGVISGSEIAVKCNLIVYNKENLSDLPAKALFQNGREGLTVGIDKSLLGKELSSRNIQGGPPFYHTKGLGTCADSEITYDISEKRYERFRAYCSLSFDNGQDAPGCVVFKVYLDNELAFESCPSDAKSAREFIDLDIRGRSELKLSVINAGEGKKSDGLANWCDAVLLSVEKLNGMGQVHMTCAGELIAGNI